MSLPMSLAEHAPIDDEDDRPTKQALLRGWRHRNTCSSSAISWSTVSATGLSTTDEDTGKPPLQND